MKENIPLGENTTKHEHVKQSLKLLRRIPHPDLSQFAYQCMQNDVKEDEIPVCDNLTGWFAGRRKNLERMKTGGQVRESASFRRVSMRSAGFRPFFFPSPLCRPLLGKNETRARGQDRVNNQREEGNKKSQENGRRRGLGALDFSLSLMN